MKKKTCRHGWTCIGGAAEYVHRMKAFSLSFSAFLEIASLLSSFFSAMLRDVLFVSPAAAAKREERGGEFLFPFKNASSSSSSFLFLLLSTDERKVPLFTAWTRRRGEIIEGY